MANQENITQGMLQTQNAVEFINKTVLQPDVKPIKGTAAPMVDQATGMMVQDLQMFLKGFEQVGLVALARLANNLLTYGKPYGPKPGDNAIPGSQFLEASNDEKVMTGNQKQSGTSQKGEQVASDILKELFSTVGEYGKMKAAISSTIHQNHNQTQPTNPTTPDSNPAAEIVHTQEKKEPTNTVHDEQDILEKSINPEIFTPAKGNETTTSELRDNTEQAIEDKTNDHDSNSDNDDDESSSDKTFWFPRKK